MTIRESLGKAVFVVELAQYEHLHFLAFNSLFSFARASPAGFAEAYQEAPSNNAGGDQK